jgi:peptidoglycan hydrolase CwlO-like protein
MEAKNPLLTIGLKEVITKGGDNAMKRMITWLGLLALLTIPILSACESRSLKQENEGLKKQIESLTSEKAQLGSQVKEYVSKGSELTARVDELTKVNEELKAKVDELSKLNEELKAKVEKKAPSKIKALPKNK